VYIYFKFIVYLHNGNMNKKDLFGTSVTVETKF